nr:hypothetical protein Iba_scaffold12409CG0010 [Ipomoea batatas]
MQSAALRSRSTEEGHRGGEMAGLHRNKGGRRLCSVTAVVTAITTSRRWGDRMLSPEPTLRRSPHAVDHPHLIPPPQAKTGGGTKSVAALHVADVQDRRERNGESAVG